MKPKPITRPSELVLSAIYNLDAANGSSPHDIVEYISCNHGINSDGIKQKVEAALKRGVSFGLISRESGGLYKLRDINELPQTSPPAKPVRRRNKGAKYKKKTKHGLRDVKRVVSNKSTKELEPIAKRPKGRSLEVGECSRNEGAQLSNSFGSTNLRPKRKS